jgi:hypothetical protein
MRDRNSAGPPGRRPLGRHDRAIAAKLGYTAAHVDARVNDGVLHAEDAVARRAAA